MHEKVDKPFHNDVTLIVYLGTLIFPSIVSNGEQVLMRVSDPLITLACISSNNYTNSINYHDTAVHTHLVECYLYHVCMKLAKYKFSFSVKILVQNTLLLNSNCFTQSTSLC